MTLGTTVTQVAKGACDQNHISRNVYRGRILELPLNLTDRNWTDEAAPAAVQIIRRGSEIEIIRTTGCIKNRKCESNNTAAANIVCAEMISICLEI
jgi:hypothetical protein